MGGETAATVAITPGNTVALYVGGAPDLTCASKLGGWNGGGNGAGAFGCGGGGASDIRIGGSALGNRVLVAGGGGGSSFGRSGVTGLESAFGGSGGGQDGGSGTSTGAPVLGGQGGSQTGGGIGENGALSGSSGQGGTAADPTDGGAGGGGGGYFGGAGGGQAPGADNGNGGNYVDFGGGGGGSGFFLPDTTRVTGGSTFNGIRSGDGAITLTYTTPATDPPPPPPASKPSIRIADASTHEGNSGTVGLPFRVTLNRSSTSPVTVHWATANGTAKAPGDFVAGSTVTFSPGQTSKNIVVNIKGDRQKEPNEVFYMLLSNPHNASLGDPNASGGILNDD